MSTGLLIDSLSVSYRSKSGHPSETEPFELTDITLRIEPGQICCVLGPSGSGKSTLLRAVGGLIKEHEARVQGTVSLDGKDVSDLSPGERQMSMVAQSLNLLPNLTVRGNLALPLKISGTPKKRRSEKVYEVAEQLNIRDLLSRNVDSLSGGERQRVALGRALVREDAKVHMYDEPFGNLDSVLRATLRKELRSIHDKVDRAALLVTHNSEDVAELADSVAVLKNGNLLQKGPYGAILRDPQHLSVLRLLTGEQVNILDVEQRPSVRGLAFQNDTRLLPRPFRRAALEKGVLAFPWSAARIRSEGSAQATSEEYIRVTKGSIASRRPYHSNVRISVSTDMSPVELEISDSSKVPDTGSVTVEVRKDYCFLFDDEGVRCYLSED